MAVAELVADAEAPALVVEVAFVAGMATSAEEQAVAVPAVAGLVVADSSFAAAAAAATAVVAAAGNWRTPKGHMPVEIDLEL